MATAASRNAYIDSLLAGQASLPSAPLSWLAELRADALERAHVLTVPTTRDEAWRFTDLSPLYRLAFRPPQSVTRLAADAIADRIIPEATSRLVFVDGVMAPALCSLPNDGPVIVSSLASAVLSHSEIVQSALTRIAGTRLDAFGAINTAYLHDGACIIASRNAQLPGPIHLLFLSTQLDVASHPRVLVIAQSGSSVGVIEDYVSLTAGQYCVNAVTEIDVGPGAQVWHAKVQTESSTAFHLASTAAKLRRDAKLTSVAIAFGARISRDNIDIVFDGEGAQCQLDGLTLIGGRQLSDTHSSIDHAKPHCTSRQLHKCIVGDTAHAVFNGRVLVRQDAQRTDSAQQSRNLLLSGRAHIDAKPQLEIFADDVKCSHGATVGQLDTEELFYLRSRGLDERAARNLLTYGFAAEIVDRLGLPSVVRRLRQAVLNHTKMDTKVDA
jgi:Fe-S cluster assembly protein SufD